jgi:hypothetical protein
MVRVKPSSAFQARNNITLSDCAYCLIIVYVPLRSLEPVTPSIGSCFNPLCDGPANSNFSSLNVRQNRKKLFCFPPARPAHAPKEDLFAAGTPDIPRLASRTGINTETETSPTAGETPAFYPRYSDIFQGTPPNQGPSGSSLPQKSEGVFPNSLSEQKRV